jgi:sugar phosphate isomerase/epimerase
MEVTKMKLNNIVAGSMGSYLNFIDLGWEPVLKGIAEAGFKYVELSASHEWQSHIDVEKITNEDIKQLKKLLEKYELTPIGISAHCDLTCREGFEAFLRRMDFAKEFNIEFLITGTGKWIDDKDLDNFYKNIEDISEYAKKNSQLVTLETHGDGKSGESHTDSGKLYLPIIKHINKKNVRVCYDTGNVIYYQAVRPEDDIFHIAKYIGYIHLKDKNYGRGVWNFPAIGQGTIKFSRIFDTLKNVGYSGPLSVEIELTPSTPQKHWEISDFNKAHVLSYEFLKDYFSSL